MLGAYSGRMHELAWAVGERDQARRHELRACAFWIRPPLYPVALPQMCFRYWCQRASCMMAIANNGQRASTDHWPIVHGARTKKEAPRPVVTSHTAASVSRARLNPFWLGSQWVAQRQTERQGERKRAPWSPLSFNILTYFDSMQLQCDLVSSDVCLCLRWFVSAVLAS